MTHRRLAEGCPARRAGDREPPHRDGNRVPSRLQKEPRSLPLATAFATRLASSLAIRARRWVLRRRGSAAAAKAARPATVRGHPLWIITQGGTLGSSHAASWYRYLASDLRPSMNALSAAVSNELGTHPARFEPTPAFDVPWPCPRLNHRAVDDEVGPGGDCADTCADASLARSVGAVIDRTRMQVPRRRSGAERERAGARDRASSPTCSGTGSGSEVGTGATSRPGLVRVRGTRVNLGFDYLVDTHPPRPRRRFHPGRPRRLGAPRLLRSRRLPGRPRPFHPSGQGSGRALIGDVPYRGRCLILGCALDDRGLADRETASVPSDNANPPPLIPRWIEQDTAANAELAESRRRLERLARRSPMSPRLASHVSPARCATETTYQPSSTSRWRSARGPARGTVRRDRPRRAVRGQDHQRPSRPRPRERGLRASSSVHGVAETRERSRPENTKTAAARLDGDAAGLFRRTRPGFAPPLDRHGEVVTPCPRRGRNPGTFGHHPGLSHRRAEVDADVRHRLRRSATSLGRRRRVPAVPGLPLERRAAFSSS